MDDIRWRDERKARAAIAKRVVPYLPAEDQKQAPARIGLLMGAKKTVEANASGNGEKDWGDVFHRIQGLRRTGKISEAAKLMVSAPTETAKIVSPDDWWVERRQLAYGALKLKQPKLAYDLVKAAGDLSVNPLKEQTFMAGWLALRHLKDHKLAKPHFEVMQKAADGPLSRAKAAYWLGRTAEAAGDKAAAEAHFRQAIEDPDTFHGLLARQKLEPGRGSIQVRPPAEPSDEEIARFVANDAVQAVIVARKSALDASLLRGFNVHLRTVFPSESGLSLVAHLSEAVGDTQMAVRTGKAAIAERKNLLYYAYPVHPFPAYTPLRAPPETAFLLGVARQETEFNTLTVSGAGAKGLLQVMTITAKHVCVDYKIKCDIARLLSDPAYNTMMASAYIGDRMAEFSGSYVLTLAGYNAGPGRAREWIKEFGDPRDPNIDPIDWIERIPIQETREYVAKVLANVQMYRARLGEEANALRIEEDLNRARRTRAVSASD
jgi:soluble lytic murein transglycosylase